MEGNAYFKEQEYKLAQKKYMLALEALPDDLRLHGNLMATYVKMDLNKEAESPAPPLPPSPPHSPLSPSNAHR